MAARTCFCDASDCMWCKLIVSPPKCPFWIENIICDLVYWFQTECDKTGKFLRFSHNTNINMSECAYFKILLELDIQHSTFYHFPHTFSMLSVWLTVGKSISHVVCLFVWLTVGKLCCRQPTFVWTTLMNCNTQTESCKQFDIFSVIINVNAKYTECSL